MGRAWTVASSLLVVATLVHADPPICNGPRSVVQFPSACVGEPSVDSASFCFGGDGCFGTGVVQGVALPAPPFVVTAFRVDGAFGSRSVGLGDFPVFLGLGDTIVAELSVTLAVAGTASARLTWLVGGEDDGGDGCGVDLRGSTPICAGPSAAEPCVGEVCVAGTCVATPLSGPCDDGDACTIGDTCIGGQCVSGPRKDCTNDPCAVGATCVAGACVGGTPVSCADDNPCTVDSCDPVAGCLHVPSNALCTTGQCSAGFCDPARGCIAIPLTGPSCDDGDGCTEHDRCTAGECRGTPVVCPRDGVACTEDKCVDGACRSVPVDARCSRDDCSIGVCRPDAPGADRDGCVGEPVGEGEACSDDGVACTEDVCRAGACLHVPIDAQCGRPDECSAAVCAPENAAADARGCAAGPPPQAGTCGEDGDPCTDDVCRGGACTHVPGADPASCAVVKPPFEKALGLAALARTLMATADGGPASAARPAGPGVTSALARLTRVDDDLEGAVRALAGREGDAPPGTAAAFSETVPQLRARLAFTHVLRTPAEVRAFLQVVSEARARAELGRDTGRTLRRRGRLLLRGTKTLKGDLQRLRRVSQTFAR